MSVSASRSTLVSAVNSLDAFTSQHQTIFKHATEDIDKLLGLIEEIEASFLNDDDDANEEEVNISDSIDQTSADNATDDGRDSSTSNGNSAKRRTTEDLLEDLLNSVPQLKTNSTKDFKTLYNACQKSLRTAEKLTNVDLDKIVYNNDWSRAWIDELIVEELCRNGFLDIAKKYIEESHSNVRVNEHYQQMYDVIDALERDEIAICLQFVSEEKKNIKELLEEALRIEKKHQLKKQEEESENIHIKQESSTSSPALAASISAVSTDVPSAPSITTTSTTVSFSPPSIIHPPFLALFPPSPPLPSMAHSPPYLASQPPTRSISLLQPSDASTHLPHPPAPPVIPLLSKLYQQQYNDLHTLEFDLHRIRFLRLLDRATSNASEPNTSTTGNNASFTDSLQYAQIHFPSFAPERLNDISALSGMLLCLPNLNLSSSSSEKLTSTQADENNHSQGPQSLSNTIVSGSSVEASWKTSSPELAIPSLIQAAETSIKKICYKRMGISEQSPLEICLKAAELAIPQLLEYREVMKVNSDWGKTSNLSPTAPIRSTLQPSSLSTTQPIPSSTALLSSTSRISPFLNSLSNNNKPSEPTIGEINVNRSLLFHSCFICPVTREECTSENPPVMLRCGHIISLQAMERMAKSSRSSRRFKCPTCPREQTTQETLVLKF